MTSLPSGVEMADISTDDIRDMVLGFLTSGQALGQLSHQEMDQIISKFSRVNEKQVIALGHQESVCPICFVPLMALLAEEETAIAMDSPAHPVEELGIIRLAEPFQCNHLFCRRDISRWVADGHDSCPTCRRPLLKRNGETNTPASDISPVNAYDPSQLGSILQRLQGVGIEPFELTSTSEIPTFLSDFDFERLSSATFPAVLSGPHTSHDNRNEYSSMYS
ncbi:hypothetical protein DFJ43DRAFT_615496 [Lentinula guzmanii]|uniref:RING-type domain-containing protein n=1 Tax=Lentinula guzmanii TaxID=2804957 RepID=A0AA38N406_9AGAR|nr:hypothetical protein DFJ43DRAFT_615496 [Lentinula guzmanii]